jgi:hypothetical protein
MLPISLNSKGPILFGVPIAGVRIGGSEWIGAIKPNNNARRAWGEKIEYEVMCSAGP